MQKAAFKRLGVIVVALGLILFVANSMAVAAARPPKPPVTYTITLKSGDTTASYLDANGALRDPKTPCYHEIYDATGWTGTWITEDAFVVGTYEPYWRYPTTGTNSDWINFYPSGSGSPGMGYGTGRAAYYDAKFNLPRGFVNPSITMEVSADDWVQIFVNDVEIPNTAGFSPSNIGYITITDPTLFKLGQNVVRFAQFDPDGAGGLYYVFDVKYQLRK